MLSEFKTISNSGVLQLNELPVLSQDAFRSAMIEAVNVKKFRVSAFFILEKAEQKLLTAILLSPAESLLYCGAQEVKDDTFLSLTPVVPALEHFEREILEVNRITPVGHPCPKPIRSADAEYYTMQGQAVHEVAVGPIHAGVIEPGHFRFQCMGEKVYSLEIFLGYQSRGVETLLRGEVSAKTLSLVETAAGDTSSCAADNFCRTLEALSNITVPERAQILRAIANELERVANHTGDLGALAGDVAFLPTASFCGRIRGDYLNLTAALCGNRFGRNFVRPGGVRYDADAADIDAIKAKLAVVNKELKHAVNLLFATPSAVERFESTGTVTLENARTIGLVGVAARACGMEMDCRREVPYGAYRKYPAAAVPCGNGDVLSRAKVRYDEIKASLTLIDELLDALAAATEPAAVPLQKLTLAPEAISVSVAEAWRGELVHVVVTGKNGEISQCKIVDPSFHNWFGLALALRGEEISNFPICNKSFNLSYCGHDL